MPSPIDPPVIAPDAGSGPPPPIDAGASGNDAAGPIDLGTPPVDVAPIADLAPPSPPPPPRSAAVLVSSPAAPSLNEQIMRRHLEVRGLKVAWLPDNAVATDAAGAALVIITPGVRRFVSFASFRDTTSAVIVMKSSALDDLDLTGTNRSVDYDEEDPDDLLILDDRHPLSAGLHGTLPFGQSTGSLAWGHPSPQAFRVAGLARVPAKFAVFAYDRGALMITRSAPARRVALLIGDRLSDRVAAIEANRLFDAAVDWSLH